ncbi:MAG: tRNA pseudouridine(55) synthase TruB [Actinomycetota bacterium]|nr:tRNA pseudouridine(55) synthase TruB [Actinomycetota bacterium]
MGHAGTLDPQAEGLLIILVNKATRLFNYFLTLSKEYLADINLGLVTDTYDMSGKVLVKKKVVNVNTKKVLSVLDKFKGKIRQVPPVYSSVKYKGKPSYVYARSGHKVDLKPKIVDINSMELISLKGDLLTIRVNCGSGTYIRSLAYDIGSFLGVGASVKNLVRTSIGDYKMEDSSGVEEFCKKNIKRSELEPGSHVMSVEELLCRNGDIYVKDKFKKSVKNGSPVMGNMIKKPGALDFSLFSPETLLKIRSSNGNLLAVHKVLSKKFSDDLKDDSFKLTKNIIIF